MNRRPHGFGLLALLPLAAAAALLGTACQDNLPKATLIQDMRILGARLQVNGDETRTTPAPGETVRVSLATVFPSLKSNLSDVQSLLVGCTAPNRFTGGIPVCQEFIDATRSGSLPGGAALPMFEQRFSCPGALGPVPLGGALSLTCAQGEPAFDLSVPDDFKAGRMLFLGIVCERGTALIDPNDPQLFACKDAEAEAIHVHGFVNVQHGDADVNHNPDPAGLRIVREVNGQWKPADPATLVQANESRCQAAAGEVKDDDTLPTLVGHIDLHLFYPASDREKDADGRPEPLEISLFSTAGKIERRYTVFDPADEGQVFPDYVFEQGDDVQGQALLNATIRYTPPDFEALPDHGKLVRFFVTLRDQRGGFALQQYAMCVGVSEPSN